MTLAEQMLDFRAKNNMPMKEAAQKAGITLQTWMHIERGIQEPSRMTERKIQMLIRRER